VIKRAFDLALSVLVLLLCSPLLLLAAIVVKLDSPGPVLFAQERVGRGFRPFQILKLRTMRADAEPSAAPLTVGDDCRVTRVGRVLRALKIDELPQFLNVLRGEMSVVGPRPEVLRYVSLYRDDYAEILRVRPGITDLASLKYRNEAQMLAAADDPERAYASEVLPDKIRLAKETIDRSSLAFDVALVVRTLLRVLNWRTDS
jgi:lipopolysaccharide/colanic/teichoic acid biosynthesis glycosyltransferase